jgi:hypothetical protein
MLVVTGFVSARTASVVRQQVEQEQTLKQEIGDLQASRGELLEFLHNISQQENLRFIDKNVSSELWSQSVRSIEALRAGKRKTAVYGAILLAWHDISLG